jgi:hypothetical protein
VKAKGAKLTVLLDYYPIAA